MKTRKAGKREKRMEKRRRMKKVMEGKGKQKKDFKMEARRLISERLKRKLLEIK